MATTTYVPVYPGSRFNHITCVLGLEHPTVADVKRCAGDGYVAILKVTITNLRHVTVRVLKPTKKRRG